MTTRLHGLPRSVRGRIARVRSGHANLVRMLVLAAFVMAGGMFAVFSRPAAATPPGKNGLIAFTRFVGSDQKVFTMPATGEKDKGKGKGKQAKPVVAKQLTKGAGYDTSPRWSPDGRKLLFLRGGDIFVINANGAGAKNLTATFTNTVSGMSWSPDGQKIAFTADGALITMDAAGGNLSLLAPDASTEVDWSPKGDKIAYECWDYFNTGNIQICTIGSDGSDETMLTTAVNNHFSPRWAPNATRIAFGHDKKIWTMAPDGSGLKAVPGVSGYVFSLAYAPDGKKIIFEHNGDLVSVSPNGGKQQTLSSKREASFDPDWQTS